MINLLSPQMLIPTKTGKEPAKKLYPKEPNPEMRGMAMMGPPHPQQVVQVPHGQPRFLAFPGGHHVSVGSAPMAFSPAGAGQPLSLPVIPVMSAAPVAFARSASTSSPILILFPDIILLIH